MSNDSQTPGNKNFGRRRFFSSLSLLTLGALFSNKAEAGTWKKVSTSINTLNPPTGTSVLKANNGGQLQNAVAGVDFAKPDTATTWSATQTFGSGLHEKKVDLAAGSAINVASGSVFTKTISGATTLTVNSVPAAGNVATFVLELTNAGAFAITWWSGVKWPGGTAPTLTASGRDAIGFYTHDGGVTWNGFVLGKDLK